MSIAVTVAHRNRDVLNVKWSSVVLRKIPAVLLSILFVELGSVQVRGIVLSASVVSSTMMFSNLWCIGDYVMGSIRVRQFFPSRVVCLVTEA